MSKRNKNKKFPCCHGCHSSTELEQLEDFHACTSGLVFGCNNLIAKVCWTKNEKCLECRRRCKCSKCKDRNEPPSLSPDDEDNNEEPATNNESLNAVFTVESSNVCSNNNNEPPSLSPDDEDNNEEPSTNNESPYVVFNDVVATNNENIEEPAATLDLDPSNAVKIPSYELKKNDPAKKGKERCVKCSSTRGVNVFYDMINLNMDYATQEFKCLNCFKPVEIVFDDDYFKCNLCKEKAVGLCHNFCNTNKQYCVYHIHCENHPGDNNNTSSVLVVDTLTPTKGNINIYYTYYIYI